MIKMYNQFVPYGCQTDAYPSSSQSTLSPARRRSSTNEPYAKLIEQPDSKPKKFRYESEPRESGGTYIIEIENYMGEALIYVCCVTAEPPYKAHPHKITGDNITKKHGAGWADAKNVLYPKTQVVFNKLGIKCVKKQNIEASLVDRSKLELAGDPFKNKFSHLKEPIDLKSVRLCFEVFILNSITGKCNLPLNPVLSEVVTNKPDLSIIHVSHCSCFANEEKRHVTIFCEKVEQSDIVVEFFQPEVFQREVEWTTEAQIVRFHKGFGIVFEVPIYPFNIEETVRCYFRLYRPSDGKTSEACPFEIHPPVEQIPRTGKRRRKAMDNVLSGLEGLDLETKSPFMAFHNYSDYNQFLLDNPVPATIESIKFTAQSATTQEQSSQQIYLNIPQQSNAQSISINSDELKEAETWLINKNLNDKVPLEILDSVNIDTEYTRQQPNTSNTFW